MSAYFNSQNFLRRPKRAVIVTGSVHIKLSKNGKVGCFTIFKFPNLFLADYLNVLVHCKKKTTALFARTVLLYSNFPKISKILIVD